MELEEALPTLASNAISGLLSIERHLIRVVKSVNWRMSSPGEGLPSLLLLRLGGGGMEPNPKGGAGGIEPGRPCSLGGKGILAIEGGGGGIPKVVPVSLSSAILAHLASIRGSLK